MGMLRILGHVTDEDAAPWFERFAELDADGNGRERPRSSPLLFKFRLVEYFPRHGGRLVFFFVKFSGP